jgi:hypothetical protein
MANQNFTLTKKYLHTLFDYKDGNLYWKIKPSKKTKLNSLAGTFDKAGYLQIQINKKTYRAHRLIFLYHHGYLPLYVDHINGVRSNNKIENLREATKSQNSYNSKISIKNKSGFKGVSWVNSCKKWRVRIWVDKKSKSFGLFNDIDYAKFVADAMRYKYHKEFSNNGEIKC